MRFLLSPSGTGSAEQWVREQFASNVEAYRRRQAKTQLIVVIDADTYTVDQRRSQLDQQLQEAGVLAIGDAEEIARLVPKRNIETWILCLNHLPVDEIEDYKQQNIADAWPKLSRTAADTLYEWTRENAAVPSLCVESLQVGIRELRKLDFKK
jgi:alanine racemase